MQWSLKLYGRTEDAEGLSGAVQQLVNALPEDPDFRGVLHVEDYPATPYGTAVPTAPPEEEAPEEPPAE